VQVERIGQEWVCGCCSKTWPVGMKRLPRERRKTDINGVLMSDDD
jgi:hypothetical protein